MNRPCLFVLLLLVVSFDARADRWALPPLAAPVLQAGAGGEVDATHPVAFVASSAVFIAARLAFSVAVITGDICMDHGCLGSESGTGALVLQGFATILLVGGPFIDMAVLRAIGNLAGLNPSWRSAGLGVLLYGLGGMVAGGLLGLAWPGPWKDAFLPVGIGAFLGASLGGPIGVYLLDAAEDAAEPKAGTGGAVRASIPVPASAFARLAGSPADERRFFAVPVVATRF